MQKKLIALAVATLASGAVLAQSNVTVYGTIDVGFTNRGDANIANVGSMNEINSGQSDASKIGFTGVEDLGNGNKVLFVLEAGFHADDGNLNGTNSVGGLFSEQAFLGATGNWGTSIAGRLVAPRHGFLASIDPFGAGTVGQYRNVYTDGPLLGTAAWDPDRVDNAVAYVSPSFGGFNVTAAYATNAVGQERVGNDGDLKTIALLPRYTNGPLDVGFSYQRIKSDDVSWLSLPAVDAKFTALTLGGTYDFKVVKLGAFYDQTKLKSSAAIIDGTKHKVWHLGATVPFGKNAIQVSYTQSKYSGALNDGEKAKQWAIGYTYALSKRTNFYAAYSDINNDDGRDAGVDDASNPGGLANAANARIGAYERGIQFGLKHTF